MWTGAGVVLDWARTWHGTWSRTPCASSTAPGTRVSWRSSCQPRCARIWLRSRRWWQMAVGLYHRPIPKCFFLHIIHIPTTIGATVLRCLETRVEGFWPSLTNCHSMSGQALHHWCHQDCGEGGFLHHVQNDNRWASALANSFFPGAVHTHTHMILDWHCLDLFGNPHLLWKRISNVERHVEDWVIPHVLTCFFMLLRQAGLGKRINMIMQTVFFKLSALLSSSFFAFTLDFWCRHRVTPTGHKLLGVPCACQTLEILLASPQIHVIYCNCKVSYS